MHSYVWLEPGKFDEDLKQRVTAFLGTAMRPALRKLEIDVAGGVVILRGGVPSYYEKQLAQEYARRVAEVFRVINLLEVRPVNVWSSTRETVPALPRYAANSTREFVQPTAATVSLAVA